jgi:hypothetical protein
VGRTGGVAPDAHANKKLDVHQAERSSSGQEVRDGVHRRGNTLDKHGAAGSHLFLVSSIGM